MELADTHQSLICIKCRKPALREQPIELLPDGGTMMKAVHPNGKECRWAEYDNIDDVMEGRKKTKNPRIIVCPACSKKGRINYSHPDKNKMVTYFVVHEPIGGEWGRKGKVKRVRRCYITNPERRDIILKKLGRYIKK